MNRAFPEWGTYNDAMWMWGDPARKRVLALNMHRLLSRWGGVAWGEHQHSGCWRETGSLACTEQDSACSDSAFFPLSPLPHTCTLTHRQTTPDSTVSTLGFMKKCGYHEGVERGLRTLRLSHFQLELVQTYLQSFLEWLQAGTGFPGRRVSAGRSFSLPCLIPATTDLCPDDL